MLAVVDNAKQREWQSPRIQLIVQIFIILAQISLRVYTLLHYRQNDIMNIKQLFPWMLTSKWAMYNKATVTNLSSFADREIQNLITVTDSTISSASFPKICLRWNC